MTATLIDEIFGIYHYAIDVDMYSQEFKDDGAFRSIGNCDMNVCELKLTAYVPTIRGSKWSSFLYHGCAHHNPSAYFSDELARLCHI